MKLSVLINNYNYARFIGDAINSALGIVWDEKEVLVLDDGSTDDSWSIIESFGAAIQSKKLPNGGQNECLNIALEIITGDMLIVLDSDDILFPLVAEEVFRVYTSRITKVQYPLIRVSSDLKRVGAAWPHYTSDHTSEYFRRKLRALGTCEFSLTSGNAWSVPFLRKVAPIPARADGLSSGFDQFLSRVAPFFGDVTTLVDPLGYYRVHDANISQVGSFCLSAIERSVNREAVYKREIGNLLEKHGIEPLPENSSEPFLMGEILLRKFKPGTISRAKTWRMMLIRYFKASFEADRYVSKALLRCCWAIAILVLPRRIALVIASKRGRSNQKLA